MENEHLDLAAKLAAKKLKIMASVSKIAKTGHNVKQNYDFVEEAEVVGAIREAMAKHGLAYSVEATEMLPVREIPLQRGSWYLTAIRMHMRLIDTETGYAEEFDWFGQGMDGGDKGLYKAYTSGQKYFLLKTFLIATGDDVEVENEQGNGAAPRQRPREPFRRGGARGAGDARRAEPQGDLGEDATGQERQGQVIVPQGAPYPTDEQWNVLWYIKAHFDKLGSAHQQTCDMTQLLQVIWGTYGQWPSILAHGDRIKSNGKIQPVRFMQPVAA